MSTFHHSLSIFFPAYNDAYSLPALIHATFEVLQAVVSDYEVIIVNDGSADDTQRVAEALVGQYGTRLKVISHDLNRGYGGALRSGFAAASKEYVFYTDADGQYDVRELPKLLVEVLPHVGLVNGYKIRRHDPWHRIVMGSLYNRCARALFGVRIKDIDCDFRLVKRSLLKTLQLTSTSGTICVELVKGIEQSGAHVVEIPVHHYPRLHGRSQFFRVRSLGTTLGQLFELWFRLFVFKRLDRAAASSALNQTQNVDEL